MRSRAPSAAFVAAVTASAPCGLCLYAASLLGLVRLPRLRRGLLGPSEPSEGAAAVLRQGMFHGLERESRRNRVRLHRARLHELQELRRRRT